VQHNDILQKIFNTQYLDRYDLVLQRLFFYKLLLILIRYIVIRSYRAIYTA